MNAPYNIYYYTPLANVNAVKCCISLYHFTRPPHRCIHYIYIYIIIIRTLADYYIYDGFFYPSLLLCSFSSAFLSRFILARFSRMNLLSFEQRTFNVMRWNRRVHGENNIITIIIIDRKPRVFYPSYTKLCTFNRIKRGRLINSYYVRLIV